MGWLKKSYRKLKGYAKKHPVVGLFKKPKSDDGYRGEAAGKSIVNTERQGGGGQIKFKTEKSNSSLYG